MRRETRPAGLAGWGDARRPLLSPRGTDGWTDYRASAPVALQGWPHSSCCSSQDTDPAGTPPSPPPRWPSVPTRRPPAQCPPRPRTPRPTRLLRSAPEPVLSRPSLCSQGHGSSLEAPPGREARTPPRTRPPLLGQPLQVLTAPPPLCWGRGRGGLLRGLGPPSAPCRPAALLPAPPPASLTLPHACLHTLTPSPLLPSPRVMLPPPLTSQVGLFDWSPPLGFKLCGGRDFLCLRAPCGCVPRAWNKSWHRKYSRHGLVHGAPGSERSRKAGSVLSGKWGQSREVED